MSKKCREMVGNLPPCKLPKFSAKGYIQSGLVSKDEGKFLELAHKLGYTINTRRVSCSSGLSIYDGPIYREFIEITKDVSMVISNGKVIRRYPTPWFSL